MSSHEQQHPFRIRTITAFLHMPSDPNVWEDEVAAAGAFLNRAKNHMEQLGYEVQTTRIATQPFSSWLSGSSSSSDCPASQQQQQQLVMNAVQFESMAAKHGIQLISIGSSSDPKHLSAIPQLIAATRHTSCSFAVPPEPDYDLAQQVATTIMQIAALTGGMGNFRFASSSNVQPGVPFFPVAAAAADLHRTFAIATESDALLHQAFVAAAGAVQGCGSSSSKRINVLAAAEQQLQQVLIQHWTPLEAAALQIEAAASSPMLQQQQQQQQNPRSDMIQQNLGQAHFQYLGLDTSLAPGLDTPALTDSYELLGLCNRFGGAGSLTISAMITKVLKGLPLRLTGYCGLMLAVCEDTGLAAAAADGSITISQLLQYSAVCGCGLDTVPVPGPQLLNPSSSNGISSSTGALQQQQFMVMSAANGSNTAAAAAAVEADARTTDSIAALICDVNTLAWRLQKPLACRLLPLPGKQPGDTTGFDHPYMVNSTTMDLDR